MNLVEPYLKTSRAKGHFDALREELNAFYESKPEKFIPKMILAMGAIVLPLK
jgi:hypothetical protein